MDVVPASSIFRQYGAVASRSLQSLSNQIGQLSNQIGSPIKPWIAKIVAARSGHAYTGSPPTIETQRTIMKPRIAAITGKLDDTVISMTEGPVLIGRQAGATL